MAKMNNLKFFFGCLILICMLISDVRLARLTPGGTHVCSSKYSQPYYVVVTKYRVGYESYKTCCGWRFLGCWSSCYKSRSKRVQYTTKEVRYRQEVRYYCCSGWARQGSTCPTPICNPGCRNGYCIRPNTCRCKPGYDGTKCENNINECEVSKPCDQICSDTIGSYTCSCRKGYRKTGSSSTSPQCTNVNECETTPCQCALPQNCHAKCLDTIGSFKCSCNSGFRLAFDQRTCQDIDECGTASLNGCQQKCVNTIGSFRCTCNKGYLLQPDKKKCLDIDECSTLNGGCSQICHNKPGTYQCSCKRGFRLGPDGKTCHDINECKEIKPCDQRNGICKNTIGSYQCSCKIGYKLLPDKKTCLDVDECAKRDTNGCYQNCTNTIGSYTCSCRHGYRLADDKRKCNDINECDELSPCDHICVNTVGSYKCKCKDGYGLEDDQHLCRALPCQSITSPLHGNITCSGYVTDEECQYTCSEGFNLIGPWKRTCLPTSRWSGMIPTCKRKTCPAFTPPNHGGVRVPCVEEYGFTCSKQCTSGYYMKGSTLSKCVMERNQTTWTNPNSHCKASTICKPNPCLNGGRCIADKSKSSYTCDCSGTLFKGDRCQQGHVLVPEFIQLFVNEGANIVVKIPTQPAQFVRIILTSNNVDVKFYPPELEIYYPQQTVGFDVVATNPGKFDIIYKLISRGEFIQPLPTRVYVFKGQSSILIDYELESIKEECDVYNLKNLELTSTCRFSGISKDTSGFVSVKGNKNTSFPLSMVGVRGKTFDVFKTKKILSAKKNLDAYIEERYIEQCKYSCSEGYSQHERIDYSLRHGLFPMAFLKEMSEILPYWLNIMAVTTTSQPYRKSNLFTKIISGDALIKHPCYLAFPKEGQDLVKSTSFYILYEPNIPTLVASNGASFTINEEAKVCYLIGLQGDTFVYSSYPLRFIVDNDGKDDINEIYTYNDDTSTDHIISELSSEFAFIDHHKDNHSLHLDVKISTRTFMGRFDFEIMMITDNIEKFMIEKFNSPFVAFGEGEITFDIHLECLGKQLVVEGSKVHSKQKLKHHQHNDGLLDIDVFQEINFQSKFAHFRFSPKNFTNIKIRLHLSGGQTTGISNRGFLLSRLFSFTRSKRFSDSVIGELLSIDENLTNIFKRKSTDFFKRLDEANKLISDENNVDNYIRAVKVINVIKFSYYNLESFIKSLQYTYEKDDTKQKLISSLQTFIRRFNNVKKIEATPNIENFKFVDTEGVVIKYNGALCIYQLCFPDLQDITVTSSPDQQFLTIKANCKQLQVNHRLQLNENDTLSIKVHKYFEKFEGKLTASVKFFDQFHPLEISISEKVYNYDVPIELPGGLAFNVSGSGDIIRATWDSLIKKISGNSDETQLFNTFSEEQFLDIANFTSERIGLLRKRQALTNEKYEHSLYDVTIVKEQVKNSSIEYQKLQSQYNKLLTQLKSERFRYSSFLKSNTTLFLIDKDLSRVCKTKECDAICIPMFFCDICQEKLKIPSKVWKCSNYLDRVRTSQMVKTEQTCQETKYNFETIYTGTCPEDPNVRRQRKEDKEKSSVAIGAGIGAIFGPIGALIGSFFGALFGGLFGSCDVTYEVITHKRIESWSCTNYTMQTVVTDVPKSSCFLDTVMVDGGFDRPKKCNCQTDKCKVKTVNATCSQINKECRLKRKLWLNETRDAPELLRRFQKLFDSIRNMEELLDDLFPTVEEKRLRKNLFESALKRAQNRLSMAEQERKIAKRNLNDEKVVIGKDLCLYQHFLDYEGQFDYLIEKLEFQTQLPILDNILISASIKQVSSGAIKSVPFIYELDGDEDSIKRASKKIVYYTICESRRRRRSIDAPDEESDVEIGFTLWDSRKNSTRSEKSCATFSIILNFFNDVLDDLVQLVDESVEVNRLMNNSVTDSRIHNKTKDEEHVLNRLIASEINGIKRDSSISSILQSWQDNSEIHTAENNFTVCLGFKDCVQTAFRTLSSIPLLNKTDKKYHLSLLTKFKISWSKLKSFNETSSLTELADKVHEVLTNLEKFNNTKWHCVSPPLIIRQDITEFKVSSGSTLLLHCGDVKSEIPVNYEWSLHSELIDGENADAITILASTANAGVYTCVVTSRAGRSSSVGMLVNVYKAPTIISNPEDLVYLPERNNSQPLVMLCEADGYPRPTITWYFKSFENFNQILLSNENGPELSFNVSEQRGAGIYHCQAKNNYGTMKSRTARYDVLLKELPKQFIDMEVDLLPENNTVDVKGISFSDFPENFTAMFDFPETQNITFFTTNSKFASNGIALHFHAESVNPLHKVTDQTMLELLTITKKNRQKLAISAGKFLSWINSNFSSLSMNESVTIKADNRSTTYRATLNDCKPGFHMHKNGIICIQCKSGFYNSNGNGPCSPCLRGTYSSSPGADRCDVCSKNKKTTSIGSVNEQQCISGEASAAVDSLDNLKMYIIGGAVGLLLVIIILLCCCCRKKTKEVDEKSLCSSNSDNGIHEFANPIFKTSYEEFTDTVPELIENKKSESRERLVQNINKEIPIRYSEPKIIDFPPEPDKDAIEKEKLVENESTPISNGCIGYGAEKVEEKSKHSKNVYIEPPKRFEKDEKKIKKPKPTKNTTDDHYKKPDTEEEISAVSVGDSTHDKVESRFPNAVLAHELGIGRRQTSGSGKDVSIELKEAIRARQAGLKNQ